MLKVCSIKKYVCGNCKKNNLQKCALLKYLCMHKPYLRVHSSASLPSIAQYENCSLLNELSGNLYFDSDTLAVLLWQKTVFVVLAAGLIKKVRTRREVRGLLS